MLGRPGLARGLLVAADGEHDHVGAPGHLDRLRDLLAICAGIARGDLVLSPGAVDGDLAAFAVEHFHALAEPGLNAFQHGDVAFRHAAIPAQQTAVGIGADHRDGLDTVRIQGQQIALVLQQRDALVRRLQGELRVRLGTHHALRLGGVHIGVVEQAHLKFPEKHRRHKFVELAFLKHAFAHQFDQVQVAIRLRQFDVDPGIDGEGARLFLGLGHEMAVRFRPVAQLVDCVVVGDHEPLEAPFLALRSTSRNSHWLACDGTPSISL